VQQKQLWLESYTKPVAGKRLHSGGGAAVVGVSTVRVAASAVGDFLADSGSDCSIVPIQLAKNYTKSEVSNPANLFAANSTPIQILGKITLTFSLRNLKRKFTHDFLVADVRDPILGRDSLAKHNLLVDCKRNRLLEYNNAAQCSRISAVSTATFDTNTQLNALLHNHSDVFQDINLSNEITHPVVHHIVTSGPPAFAKPRRLFGQKLETAKRYFRKLEAQGIVFRGESAWATPLHMVTKNDPVAPFRPCGDYHAVN
jgi:hypothetical protein